MRNDKAKYNGWERYHFMSKMSDMLNWKDVQKILAQHKLARKDAAASPLDGLLIGNADMGATVFGPSHRLTFRLSKMDLWDARMNEKNYKHPMPLSKFKEFVLESSKNLKPGEAIPMNLNDPWQGRGAELYPCMRMGADIFVRVCQREPTLPVPMTQALLLADALYEAKIGRAHV